MPLAEHDLTTEAKNNVMKVSIHVPLAEHDEHPCFSLLVTKVSIHVPLAEHDPDRTCSQIPDAVSIHVPLAEHDEEMGLSNVLSQVSIHVPLAEHDSSLSRISKSTISFQFTCPSRSTTNVSFSDIENLLSFNSRAPRGARQAEQAAQRRKNQVSIHVPLAEHDRQSRPHSAEKIKFQFTCPSRSTTT